MPFILVDGGRSCACGAPSEGYAPSIMVLCTIPGALWLGDGGIYPPLVGVQIRDREYWVIDYDLTAANFLRHTEPDIPMSYPYSPYQGQYVAEASRW